MRFIFAMKAEQHRKWFITINNPQKKGLTHEGIIKTLCERRKVKYWRIADHIGKNGTHHTHVYIHYPTPALFSVLQKRLPDANIQTARFPKAARSYVFKSGSFNHKQSEDIPDERPGTRTDLATVRDLVKQDVSAFDIIEENPNYLWQIDKIERYRQIVRREKHSKGFRDIEVIYVQGATNVGKTHWVYANHDFADIYCVSDYDHPFDEYQGQKVLVLDEYRGQIKISAMLRYLDKYPLELPCRYTNKWAAFTRVVIISNIGIDEQYENIQREQSKTWDAFLRRIGTVRVYTGYCEYVDYTIREYFAMLDSDNTPNVMKFPRPKAKKPLPPKKATPPRSPQPKEELPLGIKRYKPKKAN